ncbi:MAG: hypothetical protein IRY89_11555 [Pseudolabrys sp.]|nr:hypothetical protein [Pseudolabrys sp.]
MKLFMEALCNGLAGSTKCPPTLVSVGGPGQDRVARQFCTVVADDRPGSAACGDRNMSARAALQPDSLYSFSTFSRMIGFEKALAFQHVK